MAIGDRARIQFQERIRISYLGFAKFTNVGVSRMVQYLFFLTISKTFHSTKSRNNRLIKNSSGTTFYNPYLDSCTYKTLTSPTLDEEDVNKNISHRLANSKLEN